MSWTHYVVIRIIFFPGNPRSKAQREGIEVLRYSIPMKSFRISWKSSEKKLNRTKRTRVNVFGINQSFVTDMLIYLQVIFQRWRLNINFEKTLLPSPYLRKILIKFIYYISRPVKRFALRQYWLDSRQFSLYKSSIHLLNFKFKLKAHWGIM